MRCCVIGLMAVTPFAASASDEGDFRTATVEQFAASVKAGTSIGAFEFEKELTESEKTALANLAGCIPSVGDGSHSKWIELDWSCENRHSAERQTALKFSGDGSVSVWINPIEASLAPSPTSASIADLPSYRQLTRAFARAVKAGEDPTLEGLIPITPEQIARLSLLEGLDYRMTTGNSRGSQTMFWDIRARVLESPLATDLRFDEEGRPIGLILSGTSTTG